MSLIVHWMGKSALVVHVELDLIPALYRPWVPHSEIVELLSHRQELKDCPWIYNYIAKEPALSFESVNFPKRICKSGGPDLLNGLEGVIKCKLALLIEGEKVIVAHGNAHSDNSVVQSKPLPPENVYVYIDGYETKYAHCEVPVPSNRKNFLSEACSTFAQWPRQLVIPK